MSTKPPSLSRRDALRNIAGLAIATGAGSSACTSQATTPAASDAALLTSAGSFMRYDNFASKHVAARRIDVWLPPAYSASSEAHDVLYMHDGQNLFDPATSTHHIPWGVDKKLAPLITAGRVRPTIVVGIWNTAKRWQEYAPAATLQSLPADLKAKANPSNLELLSDAYLQFIVSELKPFIDKTFHVHTAREHTFIMGSSMGGLISTYAVARYPAVFGGAGGLSTHWPLTTNRDLLTGDADSLRKLTESYIYWLGQTLPAAGQHRFYFDHGTINLDALYAPYQELVDVMMKAKGYLELRDYKSDVYEGADHNEAAWNARLNEPLLHLLKK